MEKCNRLKLLRNYVLATENGRVILYPSISDGRIRFIGRIYFKGKAGHVTPSVPALEKIGIQNPGEMLLRLYTQKRVLERCFPKSPPLELDMIPILIEGLENPNRSTRAEDNPFAINPEAEGWRDVGV